ncbi:MAG: serine/threonine-protein kinase [Nannocystaceae bacterium]
MRSSTAITETELLVLGTETEQLSRRPPPARRAPMADTCITADEDPADPALARTGLPELDEPGAERPRGAILGRYTILNRLGAGAMGVVYLAHDVELDRRVAIKLLRAGLADERLRLRLVREAQAMARLNHPNVVTVHDVGVADGQVFVAMEEVRGVTLRAWLDERRRGWREVVEIFLMVGRGLSAAHAGGIVHRDFKPDNVMVDVDGRPRVMDFGLARAEAEVEAPGSEAPLDAASASWSSESSPLRVTLTQAGAILGTPSYMAPELWVGAVADARSDQSRSASPSGRRSTASAPSPPRASRASSAR